jgi:hypothetical protein
MRGAPKLESGRVDIRKRHQVLEVCVEEVGQRCKNSLFNLIRTPT